MRKFSCIALSLLALGGCATPAPYGTRIPAAPTDARRLADDAAAQLARLYPPAHTHLHLQQPTPDPLGQALVETLRRKGYALDEASPATPEVPAHVSPPPDAGPPAAVPLHYLFDQDSDSRLYFLTLSVGQQSITRPYAMRDGTLAAAGCWVHKE